MLCIVSYDCSKIYYAIIYDLRVYSICIGCICIALIYISVQGGYVVGYNIHTFLQLYYTSYDNSIYHNII